MPGLAIHFTTAPRDEATAKQFNEAARSMKVQPTDVANILESASQLLVGQVGYEQYPVHVFPTRSRALVILEGKIYNKSLSVVEGELVEAAEIGFGDVGALRAWARRWTWDTDGDYLVFMASPDRSELVMFSDVLGRLPVYLWHDQRQLLAARRVSFIRHMQSQLDFDLIGCGQVLWLGYPLGSRTIIQDIRRAPGNVWLHARRHDNALHCEISSLRVLNFDDKFADSVSAKTHVDALVDLFTSSCCGLGSRRDAQTMVLGLSGGLDSRAVAAGLMRADVPFVTATRLDAKGAARRDAQLAELLAAKLGLPWELVRLQPTTLVDQERIVAIKDGLNYAGMAPMLPFLECLRDRWGCGATYVTGDGGDKLFPDLTFAVPGASVRSLAEALIRKHTHHPVEPIERFLQLPPGCLYGELEQLLGQYPESDPRQKGVHFALYERGRKWLFEGEDRNRSFLWTATPFYSTPLLDYCLRVPDRLKKNRRLYRLFQMRLSPAAASVPECFARFSVASRWYTPMVSLLTQAIRMKQLLRSCRNAVRPQASHWQPPAEELAYIRNNWRLTRSAATDSQALLDGFIATASHRQFVDLLTLAILRKTDPPMPDGSDSFSPERHAAQPHGIPTPRPRPPEA